VDAAPKLLSKSVGPTQFGGASGTPSACAWRTEEIWERAGKQRA
jgi:hypothetical protein